MTKDSTSGKTSDSATNTLAFGSSPLDSGRIWVSLPEFILFSASSTACMDQDGIGRDMCPPKNIRKVPSATLVAKMGLIDI